MSDQMNARTPAQPQDGDGARQAPITRRGVLARGGTLAAAGLALTLPWAARANTQDPPEPKEGRADAQGRFAGKVVLITGATSGIGQTTANAFAKEGAKVFFCGRREELGRANEAEIRAFGGEATYLRADVREEGQVQAFVDGCVDAYGRIDIAFNNAGIESPPATLAEQTLDTWLNVMTTNATGVFLSMKYELPHMLRQGGGVIVNNASVSGHVGYATIAPYNASKHAIMSLTKVAALEYADKNIRVNSISPGAVDTPMLRRALAAWNLTLEEVAQGIPVKRIATAEEMARAVMWLSTDEASAVVGTDLDVTSGMLTL